MPGYEDPRYVADGHIHKPTPKIDIPVVTPAGGCACEEMPKKAVYKPVTSEPTESTTKSDIIKMIRGRLVGGKGLLQM